MSAMLSREPEDALPRKFGAQAVFVGVTLYRNSAAKFWTSLVDEVVEDFPKCSRVRLSAQTPRELCRGQLFPDAALQEDMDRLATVDLESAFRDALAELTLLGPPAGVTVRLLEGEREILSRCLPLECMDADVFDFIVVWLPEWAGIAESEWNRDHVQGRVAATDVIRSIRYDLDFTLAREHVREGLYRREVGVRFKRRNLVRVEQRAVQN
jgi:hypothetical protein